MKDRALPDHSPPTAHSGLSRSEFTRRVLIVIGIVVAVGTVGVAFVLVVLLAAAAIAAGTYALRATAVIQSN